MQKIKNIVSKVREKIKEGFKSGLRKSLLRVTLIPTILFGVIITVYCSNQMANSIYHEVETGLKNVAQSANYMYETEYPGEYRFDSETSEIYKGDKQIESASRILEAYKGMSGADITIFYKDMRIVTTIRNAKGEPIVGTKSNSVITKEVLNAKEEKFYTRTSINGENYFSYYAPIYDKDKKCVGMVFAGKSSEYVSRIVREGVLPVATIIILSIVVLVVIMWRYAEQLSRAMQKLERFLMKVEDGNFEAELGSTIVERKDELGQIGRSAVQMQTSLRELIERDSLTGLYNRHYGEVWVKEVKTESEITGTPCYVAIADIDHFKKFNDNYGHDCGDLVLKQVSRVLESGMKRRGYASRWGGEEFLLVFNAKDEKQAISKMERIAEEIRKLRLTYGEEELSITITIGVAEGKEECQINEWIKIADRALYEGKENGRNQVRIGRH